jgi:hypothetical protein
MSTLLKVASATSTAGLALLSACGGQVIAQAMSPCWSAPR